MNERIESAIQHVRGYWFIDGFIEMAAGGLLVLLAGSLLFSEKASPATFSAWFLSIAGEISVVKTVGIVAAVLILWWLKDHFTYPRTGFVKGKRITATQVFVIARNALLFLLLPILVLLAVAVLLASWNRVVAAMPAWFPAGLGILWAILLALSGEWFGLRRFRVLAALTLLAGIAVGAWELAAGLPANGLSPSLAKSTYRTLTSLSWLTLICGVLLVFSGLLTFLHYRKENPSSYTEEA